MSRRLTLKSYYDGDGNLISKTLYVVLCSDVNININIVFYAG